MAYRRPAIEVIQEFQEAAAALALPSLPACVVGPGFQIEDGVNAGVYDEANLAVTSYSYVGLQTGAIVDLDDAPDDEADANAHQGVSVVLQNAYLVKEPATPAVSKITGELASPNLFQDAQTGAFSSFDPDAAGAPTYYVDVIGGTGVVDADKGRKLVISKNDDNELVVAAEWQSTVPITNVEYRILEFREEEEYPEDEFSNNGIAKTSTGVNINPGLESVTDATPLPVVEGDVYLGWRALRPDLAGALTVFTDLDSLEAVFGIGAVVPANVGAFAVNLALLNTTTEVNYTGLSSAFFTNEEQAFQDALEYLETKDVYGIALLTHTTAIHQTLKSHVEGQSLSTVGRERVGFISRKLSEIEVVVPASGLGTETSSGTGNGLSGTDNLTFKDPDNGSFITDEVGVGHYLEITSYTAVEGIQRSVTPNEKDYFGTGPDRIQMNNAAFVGTDVGRYILVRGATTLANDIVFSIASIISGVQAGVTPTPPAAEVMAATTRAWICDKTQDITYDASDAVVAATKTWTFPNANFTTADIGRLLVITNAPTAGNNGVWTIGGIASPTAVTTVEVPVATEALNNAPNADQSVYSINREPTRDYTSDWVDATSRQWTLLNALFTSEDVGRKIDIAGTAGGTNDGEYVIEAVISSTVVRTDNSNVPVDEVFDGLATVLTTLDIISVTPSTEEDEYITGTRHEIAGLVSETQLTLGTDPTSGFGGTLEDVVYRITKDLSLTEQASLIAGYSTSLGSRRIVSTWPDILAVSVNGVATKVPGYFAGPVLSGLTAGLPSQAGFTNLTVAGFVGRENSDDKFSDTQLDTIAGGGTMIFVQPVPDAALQIRHQLTTDVSTIYFQEFSVTKNVDLIARFFRGLYAPFLGIYNITDGLLDLLKTRGEGGIAFLVAQRAPRVGAPLRGGQLSRIEESATQPDTVEIDVSIKIPLPLNNIKLTLLV
jgi:hypothetical protein